MHEYAHGVIERELPASGERCRPSGRCRTPRTTSTSCATRCRRRSRAAGIEPDAGHRDRHRLHGVDAAAGAAPTAPRCAGWTTCASARTPTPKLWKHHAARRRRPTASTRVAARARRAVARALRRPDLVGVGVRQGAADARGGPRGLRARWTAGSRPPTGSSGSSAARETRNTCTAGYKGIFQDGQLPVRGLPARARRALRELRLGEDRRPARPARRAGRRPHRAGRANGPVCRRGSRSRSATSTHMSPRPPRGRSSQARCSPSWALRRATS